MNEKTPLSSNSPANDLDDLSLSIKRVGNKIQLATETVKKIVQDRVQLEGKIEDAQKRIQHILSRLPEQSDGRQMNLLGEAVSPSNPEDGNEPTTH